ncbi:MAG: hypothetical protein Q8Q09_04960 [Deltaproteobacteria bacterium]|nr:hypothetical protein [Deltaproteobacteria bacterium]
MNPLHEYFRSPMDIASLAARLDGMTHHERVRHVCDLGAREQAQLFDAAKGVRKLSIEDFVPERLGELTQVVHHGRNSLPVFTRFEKRFCRAPQQDHPGELWGYNEQIMKLVTGPGYFVAYNVPDDEVLIDYTRVPPRGAPGWPAVLPNSARLSRVIYNGTKDLMRGVSKHVSIGRAARAGKDMDNWFVLVREDQP